MAHPFRILQALPVYLFFTCIAGSVNAQKQKSAISEDSLRRAIVQAVAAKITKSHYAPKPFDDNYSLTVWESFIKNLDPSRNVFLQEDINKLNSFKTTIDDDIRNVRTEFFDAAYTCWLQRIRESQTIVENHLKKPLPFISGEEYLSDRSRSAYPATKEEKDKLWQASLKSSVLKYYTQMEGDISVGAALDTSLERKARNQVATWYRRWFKKYTSENALNDRFNLYVNSITLAMDPHSSYTFPKMEDQLSRSLRSAYFGIGMELGFSETDVFVKRLSPYGSAYKSGLIKENDRIIAIQDNTGKMVAVEEVDPTDIPYMIRGEAGTSVTMKLMQPGAEERTVTIQREELNDNSNKAKSAVVISNGRRIGYLYLPIFYLHPEDERLPGCSADIFNEIEKLKDQEVEGIVFDLRGNGGGSLTEVVRMCASFIKTAPVSFLRSTEKVDMYSTNGAEVPQWTGPLTVLIDESSASASEIFAGVMQDYKRGLIIGSGSSYGKGTAQMIFKMGKMGNPSTGTPDVSYGNMRLTQQKFYRVSGATTQLRGVQPDIVLAEKTIPNIITEKDLPGAMPPDTIVINELPTPWEAKDYSVAVAKSKQRILDNTRLQILNDNMKKLQKFQKSPIPLSLDEYRKYKQQLSQFEKNIQSAKIADQELFQVLPSLFTRFSPRAQKKEEIEESLYNTWLQKINKDIFLQQAVLLVQDMKDAETK